MASIFRIIKFAFQDIVRNASLSLMTILILVLMLLSINTLFIVDVLTKQATASIKEQIDVSIYFDHEASDENITEIRDYVSAFPEVVEMNLYTKDQVLEKFKEEHAQSPEILKSLEELKENPLGATMVVKMKNPGDYKKIIDALSVPEYEYIIEAKTFGDTERAINKIDTITTQVERFSLALSAFFAIIAFLIIFNTIRVSIFTQRIEISIKKLVGATNWFIRGPYILVSLIFSIISTAIAYTLVVFGAQFLDPYIAIVFQTDPFLTNYFKSNIIMLAGLQLISVFLLTLVSSMLAMRRHLRV
ncbi:MAG: permease-like cell division protein FtsX [Candidatus Magasanikbacteria bacterium]